MGRNIPYNKEMVPTIPKKRHKNGWMNILISLVVSYISTYKSVSYTSIVSYILPLLRYCRLWLGGRYLPKVESGYQGS